MLQCIPHLRIGSGYTKLFYSKMPHQWHPLVHEWYSIFKPNNILIQSMILNDQKNVTKALPCEPRPSPEEPAPGSGKPPTRLVTAGQPFGRTAQLGIPHTAQAKPGELKEFKGITHGVFFIYINLSYSHNPPCLSFVCACFLMLCALRFFLTLG